VIFTFLFNESDLKETVGRSTEFAVLNIIPHIPSPATFAECLFDVVASVISFFTKYSNGVFAQYRKIMRRILKIIL